MTKHPAHFRYYGLALAALLLSIMFIAGRFMWPDNTELMGFQLMFLAIAYVLLLTAYIKKRPNAPHIVKDQDELDALPIGSVVIDSYRAPLKGDVYRSALTNGRVAWFQAGPQGAFVTVCFPAKVLHRTDLPTTTELFLKGLISQ